MMRFPGRDPGTEAAEVCHGRDDQGRTPRQFRRPADRADGDRTAERESEDVDATEPALCELPRNGDHVAEFVTVESESPAALAVTPQVHDRGRDSRGVDPLSKAEH